MAKKMFINPFIVLSATPGDDVVPGGGTGQTTTDPFPMAYGDEWKTMFGEDHDLDGEEGTFDDYGTWWADNSLGLDSWNEFNPGVPWNSEWGDPG